VVVTVAVILPPIYRSQVTIQIEEQEVSQDYIRSTVTSYASERLGIITQQVMSRSILRKIIDLFNLYPELRKRKTMGEVLQHFRKSINIEPITSLITDKRTGRSVEILTAFIISYEGETPDRVQKVANNLANLYIEGDTMDRGRRASATTYFFQEELDRLKDQIREHEEKISRFKQDHVGELPEYNTVNMRAVNQLELEVDKLLSRRRNLEQKRIQLTNFLADTDPMSPIYTEKGKPLMNPSERLKQLRLQLIDLQANLSDKHPDVARLKRTIEILEAQGEKSSGEKEKRERLEVLKTKLTELKGKYGPRHPDVLSLEKNIDRLSQEIREDVDTEDDVDKTAYQKAENPKYRELETQITIIEKEIETIRNDEKEIKKEIRKIQKKIERAPIVEKEFNEIARDYETAKRKYNEIMGKLMQAKVAQGLEEKQRGERFSIVDPAPFPEKPYKPNRKAILILGFILAVGTGSMLAILLETFDNSVHSADDLARISGIPVISIIDNIETKEERRKKRTKKVMALLVFFLFIFISIVIIDKTVIPINRIIELIGQRLF